ncbi:YlaH-like family protein [Kurthia sibirica]|nr:YlaH-like family protein [Kurthia sibirica]GEK32680.1 hypothetical protein KSI01_02130 [Kurthia sibirica]
MFKSGLFELNFMQVAAAPSDSTYVMSDEKAKESLSGIVRYLYDAAPSYDSAGYILLGIIFVLSAIVYHLGFARSNLKLWQNIIIYIFLFLGCIILTFLSFFLPMVEVLVITVLFLLVYKLRLKRDKQQAENKA